MLGGVAGLGRLRAHGLGRERGPLLPGEAEAPVQLVANRERVVEVERDQGGRDVAGDLMVLAAGKRVGAVPLYTFDRKAARLEEVELLG